MCAHMSVMYKLSLKMYAGEWDVQKLLFSAQNVCLGVRCAKSALYSTKCTFESRMCKRSTKRTPESVMYKICHVVLNPPKKYPCATCMCCGCIGW